MRDFSNDHLVTGKRAGEELPSAWSTDVLQNQDPKWDCKSLKYNESSHSLAATVWKDLHLLIDDGAAVQEGFPGIFSSISGPMC